MFDLHRGLEMFFNKFEPGASLTRMLGIILEILTIVKLVVSAYDLSRELSCRRLKITGWHKI